MERSRLLVVLPFLIVACDAPPKAEAPEPSSPERFAPMVLAPPEEAPAEAPVLNTAPRARGEEGKFGKKDKPSSVAASPFSGIQGVDIADANTKKTTKASSGVLGGIRGTAIGDAGGADGLGTRGHGEGGSSIGIGSLGSAGGKSLGMRGTGAGGGGYTGATGSGYGRGTGSYSTNSARNAGLLGALAAPAQPNASGDFGPRNDSTVNARTVTKDDALSTFAADVDTAAYAIARRTLNAGQLPTASLVRVEETINYFAYDYDPPTDAPFSIQVDGAQSPVDASKHYLRVGLQAKVVADADRLPANLVFLVDTSCSMTSGDKLALASESLAIAVDQLTAKDRVAITTYAGGVRLVLPPTRGDDKAKIKAALASLRTGGGTAMSSGLQLAYRQAAQMVRPNTTTRIIVCSDGDANIGATSHEEMLKQVRGYVDEGIRLSTIGFGDGNYRDATMEQLANDGNGNYYYVDSRRMAHRVFARDFTKMVQDVAQDVKIQVEFDPATVHSYRLVGYENRAVADEDFRNDKVDAGEIGAGHQVTALYELVLEDGEGDVNVATVRVRSKRPGGTKAKEVARSVEMHRVARSFEAAPQDLKFAVAAMGAAELWRKSEWAGAWTYARVASILSDVAIDADRRELLALVEKSKSLDARQSGIATR